jgi:tetratricopeptide (TPR) repeat protein
MLCQVCGKLNPDEQLLCTRCGFKLEVISRSPLSTFEAEPPVDEDAVPIEEHLIERISSLEEIVRRTAESLRVLVDYLFRTERSAAVSEAGVRALAEVLASKGIVPEVEFRELWDRKSDERAGALDVRERFAERREAILDSAEGRGRSAERFRHLVSEADFHILSGDKEKGLEILSEAVRLDRRNADLHLFLGETYFNAGDLDRARPHLDSALVLQPQRLEALVYRGAIAAERGDRKKAVEILERAIGVEPSSALPRLALGAFFALRGEWKLAKPHLEAALAREESVPARFLLGQIEAETGDLAAAIEQFDRVLEADPTHEEALYELGLCYLDRGWSRRARECFEKALALNPTRIEYQQASQVFRRSGGAADALGREAAGLYRQAEKRASAGSLPEAFSLLCRARQADPENPVLATAHALLASSLGRTAEAISSARDALRRDPPEIVSVGAYVALLESLRGEGSHAEAVRTADEMLRGGKSQLAEAVAHYERAMAISDSGDEGWLSEALRSAERSLRCAPREVRPLALEAIGWVYYRRREYREAVDYLGRASAAFPSRSALAHFGTALLAAGERGRARELLRRAGRVQKGAPRIEDRFREQVRRKVRLDESARHEARSPAEESRPALGGEAPSRRVARRGQTPPRAEGSGRSGSGGSSV